ncbi:arabinofuranosyltransferase [Pseudonocardia nantongensis]|uniref:arabinofuranosyltransferase n=1 Tax=Pseudonocardia nantongensis TaxID=1181885 RepID=UPI00397D4127
MVAPGSRGGTGSWPRSGGRAHARWPWRVAELILAPVVAVLVVVAVLAVVDRLDIPTGTNVGLALTASAGALLALLLAGTALLHRRIPWLAVPLSWAGLAALPTVPLALFLANTPHYLFGVSGDQQFRVQFLTRFADSGTLADFAYADLPPYYPAAWFWVGGRTAALLGVDAWAFHKPYALATLAVTAVLAYVLWSLVTSRPRALGAAVATVLAGLATTAAYTPYSWLTGALVPPLAVLGLRLVRAQARRSAHPHSAQARRSAHPHSAQGPWVRTAVLVGLVLGLAAITHTQILMFAGFVLAVLAADGLLTRRASPLRVAGTAGVVLLAALPLTLLHWLPYLIAAAGGGPTYSAGQHFLAESGSRWPLPMLEPTALGALCLAGTVWIVWRFRSSEVARALGATAACGYAWYLLSTAALAAGTTLLAFRIEPILTAALACGAVGAAADLVHAVRERVPGDRARPAGDAARPDAGAARPDRRAAATGLVVVLAATAVLAGVQDVPEQYSWAGSAQDYRPDGTRPDGSRDPADADAWLGELRITIDGLTGRAPRDVVVLTANQKLVTYTPYFSYQASSAQYANPLGNFPTRTAEIRRWAAAPDPAALLAALDSGPARPPSVLVFSRTGDGALQVPTTEDRFPDPDSSAPPATFAPQLFEDPAWQRRDVGPYAVLVRAGVPPVP